jgi:hypothetical protein
MLTGYTLDSLKKLYCYEDLLKKLQRTTCIKHTIVADCCVWGSTNCRLLLDSKIETSTENTWVDNDSLLFPEYHMDGFFYTFWFYLLSILEWQLESSWTMYFLGMWNAHFRIISWYFDTMCYLEGEASFFLSLLGYCHMTTELITFEFPFVILF